MHSIWEDSSSTLELDTFKEKIRTLYNSILEKTYRNINPAASPEEIAMYVQENTLQFPDEQVEEDGEIDELMEMLDSMIPSDDTQPASEMEMEDSPKEHTGEQLQSKTHEKGEEILTKELQDKMGGLFKTHTDERTVVRSKKPEDVTSKPIRRKTLDEHLVVYSPLVEEFKEELKGINARRIAGLQQFRKLL